MKDRTKEVGESLVKGIKKGIEETSKKFQKDEIKETLEDIKRHLDYVEATKQASIRDNEMKVMYDYITNLQEERDDYKHKFWEEQELNEYLQDRIDKAIEYIKKEVDYSCDENCDILAGYRIDELLNILQNGEENE